MSNFASSLLATLPVAASQSPTVGTGGGDVSGGLFESLLATLAGEGGVAMSPETTDAGDPAWDLSQGAPDPTQVAMPPIAGGLVAPALTLTNADGGATSGEEGAGARPTRDGSPAIFALPSEPSATAPDAPDAAPSLVKPVEPQSADIAVSAGSASVDQAVASASSAAPSPASAVANPIPPSSRAPLPVTAPFEAATVEELAARGFRTASPGVTSAQSSGPTAAIVAPASTATSQVAPSPSAEAPRATVAPTAKGDTAVVEPALATPAVAPAPPSRGVAAAAEPRKAVSAGQKEKLASPTGVTASASPVKQTDAADDLSPVEVVEAVLTSAADGTEAVDTPADSAAPAPSLTPPLPQESRPALAPVLSQAAAGAETAPRGAPETVARLAADIVHKLEGKSTRFDLELAPEGLGRVDVSVEIAADGSLTASLSFDSAQAAADLRGRSGELRQALEQAGFSLTDDGLSFDLSSQGDGGAWSGAQTGDQDRSWSGGRAFRAVQSGLEEADLALSAALSEYARTPSGGVDIRI